MRDALGLGSSPSQRSTMKLWIGLAVGGCVVVMAVVALAVLGRLATNRVNALTARGMAVQGEAALAGPSIYESPTGAFRVEFPAPPKRDFVRSTEPGGMSRWEASLTIGEFERGRGEQFLVIESPLAAVLTADERQARLAALVSATVGNGQVLSSADVSQGPYVGRDVTYQWLTKQGGQVAGRYRAFVSDRQIISVEWVAAPAKPETPELKRFFDSFQLVSDNSAPAGAALKQ